MGVEPHTRLAGECLQPLGHLSGRGSSKCRDAPKKRATSPCSRRLLAGSAASHERCRSKTYGSCRRVGSWGRSSSPGGVAERSNAPVLKTGVRESGPRVRIPPPPLANVATAMVPVTAPCPASNRIAGDTPPSNPDSEDHTGGVDGTSTGARPVVFSKRRGFSVRGGRLKWGDRVGPPQAAALVLHAAAAGMPTDMLPASRRRPPNWASTAIRTAARSGRRAAARRARRRAPTTRRGCHGRSASSGSRRCAHSRRDWIRRES